jgi:glycosyltransferase involved in cell wall biosynthesis
MGMESFARGLGKAQLGDGDRLHYTSSDWPVTRIGMGGARMQPMKPMSPPGRLAVYGYVNERVGSLCIGHFLALRELLRRGTQIDFFAVDGWIDPGSLAVFPNLTYRPVRHELCRATERTIEVVPVQRVRSAVRTGFLQVARHLYWNAIGEEIRRAHVRNPYDATLVVGLLSPWGIPGLPTVSWTQGPPNGESGWYRRNVKACIKYMGAGFLPLIAGGYSFKHFESVYQSPFSDVIIAGSRWSASQWRKWGVKPDRLTVMPYPVDLEKFHPLTTLADKAPDDFLFLHAGRIALRKRVDLLLDAMPLVTKVEPGARLKIIGGNMVPGLSARLANASPASRIEHSPVVEHHLMPGMIARADCIVQPSENENFGSTVAEALACGRPVLVGPTNGTKDYTGSESVVLDECTPEAVARGMLEVISRIRADRAGLTARCRETAERYFRPSTVVDRLCVAIEQSRSLAIRRGPPHGKRALQPLTS